MKVVNETSAGAALISVVLLFLCAGSAGTPAFAQYNVPPEGQYDSPPPATSPLPEENQYSAPPEDQNDGGGTTGIDEGTAPIGEGDDGANGATPPERPPPPAAGIRPTELLNGVLVDGLKLFAVLSVVTTLLFFVERSQGRRGV